MASSAELAVDIASGQESVDARAVMRKTAWRLMPPIMLCYLFAFFDRINISFAKFQLQSDLHLSETAYGLGAALFVVGYVLLEVPSNMVLYKVGARRWIARIMISWGIATSLMALVHSEWQFYALRFLIGAMEAGFARGVLFYLTLWFPADQRGRMTALLFLAPALSGLIGAPMSGLILGHMDGVLGMRGWHWLFLCGGVPCVLLGLVVLRMLKDRVQDATWLTLAEKRDLSARISQETRHAGGHSLGAALRTPGFLILGLVYFLIQIASYGLNFWAPQIIVDAGIHDPSEVGLLAAVPYVCGALSMLACGWLTDRNGRRHLATAILIGVAALGFVVAGLFGDRLLPLVLALALIGAGVVAAVPAFWALPPRLLSGAGAASGIALINTLGQFGGIVSPVMVGRIRDLSGSTTPALYVIGCLAAICALILWVGLPARLREDEDGARQGH